MEEGSSSLFFAMTYPACPEGTLKQTLNHSGHWECSICGHEWPKAPEPESMRVVKDAHGNILGEGDTVTLVKDLKLGGGSKVNGRPRTHYEGKRGSDRVTLWNRLQRK